MRVIETEALTLEPQTAEHAEAMFAVLSDQAIYEFENEPPKSLETLRERYTKLETRKSGDGQEGWLNWVIRIPSGELIGYVQATVFPDARAAIAYELHSDHWGRGLARTAVEAMIEELRSHYGVRTLNAWLKRANFRSLRFLQKLAFSEATDEERALRQVEADELLMIRNA